MCKEWRFSKNFTNFFSYKFRRYLDFFPIPQRSSLEEFFFFFHVVQNKIRGNEIVTDLILSLEAMQAMSSLEFELRARQSSMRKVEKTGEQRMTRWWFPVAGIRVEPNV